MNNKYENDDEVLLAKVEDKQRLANIKNKITYTDFLNDKEQVLINKKLNLKKYLWFGEENGLDRKVLIFYPEKLDEEILKRNLEDIISVIRITLPTDMKRKIWT